MAVIVTYKGMDTKYDDATGWSTDDNGFVTLEGDKGLVALYPQGFFEKIRIEESSDTRNEFLSEAKELIQTVDDGSWRNQSDDWKETADGLVNQLKGY